MEKGLKIEFEYFLKNQADLVKLYNGKFVVIKGASVIGVYDSEEEAFLETKKSHELGTFLIQECKPGSEVFSQTFHSRVQVI